MTYKVSAKDITQLVAAQVERDPSMGDEKHQKELNIIHQKPELNFDHNKVYNIQGTDNPMVRC